ncbi:MAG: hypothetical protein P1V19_17300 [Gimesia sp.]|nr:hypothetical protein [Gimesia sp.]
MAPSQLNPGDTVIPLAGLVVTTSIISGAINSSIIVWRYNQTWYFSLVAFFVGAILSWLIAKYIGLVVFPSQQEGTVFVVKSGVSALPLTLKASVIGAGTAVIICGYLLAFMLGGTVLLASSWFLITVTSIIIAGLWGTLSALL